MSETTSTSGDAIGGYVSAATAVVGGWIVISAFFYAPPPPNFWNDVVVGAAIGSIAGYDAVRTGGVAGVSAGAASLVTLLGLWMVVAPFLFPVDTDAAFWNDVVNGAIVAVLAGYNAYQARATERQVSAAEAETR